MEVEIGTADKLDKVDEDHFIGTGRVGGAVRGLSRHEVEDDGDGQEAVENGEEDEGCMKKQEDFKVARPPEFWDFIRETSQVLIPTQH